MCADPDSPNLVLEDMYKARDGLTSVKSHNSVARYVTDTVRKTILNSVNPVRAPVVPSRTVCDECCVRRPYVPPY